MGFELKVDDELLLRLVEPSQVQALYDVVDANREHIGRWLPWLTPDYCLADARENAERAVSDFAERKAMALSLVVGGRYVGRCGLVRWQQETLFAGRLVSAKAEIGYWLAADVVGRGLMTRAVRALTTYAFETYGLDRIKIVAEPDNVKSWGVAERLGYKLEGTHRCVARVDGRAVDHRVYAMLAQEWKP